MIQFIALIFSFITSQSIKSPTVIANGPMQITLNEDCLAQNIKLLSSDSIQRLSEIQDRTEKFTEESDSLQKKIAELKEENKKDVAFKIRERQIEKEVVTMLHTEVLEQFPAEKARNFRKTFPFCAG